MTDNLLPPPHAPTATYRILGKRINVRMFTLPLPKMSLPIIGSSFLAAMIFVWFAFMFSTFGGVKLFTGPKLYEGQIVRIEPLGNITGTVTGRRDFGVGDAYYIRYTLHGQLHQDSFQRWHLTPNPLERK